MADKIYGFNEEQYARLADMLRAYEGGSLWPPAQRGRKPDERQLAKIRFRNDNSGTVPAWGVMRITGASTTTGGSWFATTNQPNTTLNRYYLVNSGREVETGKFGWGTYLWHSNYVLYDTGNTPAYGETWGPQNGTWTIKKNNWGFNIVGGNTGSGSSSRTLAVQHVVNHLLGKTNASHAKSASGTVNLYTGTLGSETQVTSMTVTAYNRFAAVSSGKWVHCSWVNGGWDLSAAEC